MSNHNQKVLDYLYLRGDLQVRLERRSTSKIYKGEVTKTLANPDFLPKDRGGSIEERSGILCKDWRPVKPEKGELA
jgi:hypothetical protein